MAILSDGCFMGSLVLPSVWKGYVLPRSVIMGTELPFKEMISAKGVPQEWLDKMVNVFQNGSIANFYDKYLEKTFSTQDHEQVLLEADEILKTDDLKKWHVPEDPLIAIASIDIAHNADEYGHRLFKTACFLKDQDQLPKECRFMFWRKINPALYEEKESFEIVEKALFEPTQKIPEIWTQNAFYKWAQTDDSAHYLSQMEKMAALEFALANNGQMPVDCAIKNYVHDNRVFSNRNKHRPPRRSWRGYT